MVILFGAVSFLSAALVFLVQPMVARMVLPTLGGSPQVWTTSMLFFQLALLAGYGYTHLITTRLDARRQTWLHIGLAATVMVTLPIGVTLAATPGSGPVFALLIGLLTGVAAPFILLSSTGPLVQRWLSWTTHPAGRDPYFLWVAGNLGSALGLLAYPLLVEQVFSLRDQSRLWAAGYAVVVTLLALCARQARRRRRTPEPPTDESSEARAEEAEGPLPGLPILRWIIIAAVPVSLTLGITTVISTDIAAIPLMWVAPLFLYLVSHAVAFSRAGPAALGVARWLAPATAMATLLIGEAHVGLWGLIGLHLFLVLVGGLLGHGLLAAGRPPPRHLTTFYLAMAVGGALGGLFNAVVAPVAFPVVIEHALAMVAVVALSVRWRIHFDTSEPRRRVLAIGAVTLVLGSAVLIADRVTDSDGGVLPQAWLAVVLSGVLVISIAGRFGRSPLAVAAVLALGLTSPIRQMVASDFADRTFFGTHRIVMDGGIVFYYHGTTVHGIQDPSTPETRRKPSAYYAEDGPMGDLMAVHDDGDLGILGLGVGGLAAYGQPGQTMVFHEIDPAVVDIASTWFTYLDDTEAEVEIILGDGRLTMADVDARYEWMLADAFTSDAVPIHLVTVEAIETYLHAVEDGGTLVFHISNRYVDLEPVMRGAADHLALHAALGGDPDAAWGSLWVAMSSRPERIDALKARGWRDLAEPSILWTDQRSNLLSVLMRN